MPMDTGITLLLFAGGKENSQAEALVTGARRAAALDTIATTRGIPDIGRIIVSTDSPDFAHQLDKQHVQVELDDPDEPFHFGRRLQSIITQFQVRKALYMGAGSGVLLSLSQLASIVSKLKNAERLLLVNNHYSTDFAAFTPADVVLSIEPPHTDNNLSFRLAEAGLEPNILPRSAATMLDIDTPTDLMTAILHPQLGPHTRRYIEASGLDVTRVRRITAILQDSTAEFFVLGRVASSAFAYLETRTSCQTRLLCEERGMRASGRQARGEVRSLAGLCLNEWGPCRFVRELGRLCDGALIDSRVLFAHRGPWPSTEDRFNSDLLRPENIRHPFVRQFTEAIQEATIPILLGGHSLVSGGLYALVEASQNDLGTESRGCTDG